MAKNHGKKASKRVTRYPPISASRSRVALYHRVSTLDQDPKLADRELRAHAERIGGKVVLSEHERASGVWSGRPALRRILDAAKAGELDVVVVWKLDRFGRSALDLLANIRELEDAGVRFIAFTQGIDIHPGGDAMGRLMLTMLAAVAEFERDLIRERTLLGLAKARASGRRLGRPQDRGPSGADVRRLRRAGNSWASVARALSCTVAKARRRAAQPGQ